MSFTAVSTILPGVLILEPKIFNDDRGFFFESFNQKDFQNITGLDVEFVQDNHSRSTKGVLRGLHYQIKYPQGKLIRVIQGSVFDVVVDLRISSPKFQKWIGVEISSENKRQLWVPRGFAHGFVVTSKTAIFSYKCDELYAPEFEKSIQWNDPNIGVEWPVTNPSLSNKDLNGTLLQSFNDKDLPHV